MKAKNELERLTKENQELKLAVKWLLDIAENVDHDCKASPDSACRGCAKIEEIKELIK